METLRESGSWIDGSRAETEPKTGKFEGWSGAASASFLSALGGGFMKTYKTLTVVSHGKLKRCLHTVRGGGFSVGREWVFSHVLLWHPNRSSRNSGGLVHITESKRSCCIQNCTQCVHFRTRIEASLQ